MIELRRCQGINERGEPCGKPPELVGDDGYCASHRAGGREHMRSIGAAGGSTTGAKHATSGLHDGELPLMTDTQTVMDYLNVVSQGLARRAITEKEAQAYRGLAGEATKAIAARIGERLETEAREQLAAKEAEIADLRRQIADLRGTTAALKVAR